MNLRLLQTNAALLLSLAAADPGHATVTYVAPGDAGSFALDVDGDGQPEIDGIVLSPVEYSGVAYYGDGLGEVVVFPDRPFAGLGGARFATMGDLVASSTFCGDYQAPSSITRPFDDYGAGGFILPEEPVWAVWSYGTGGTGSDPVGLVGVVIDLTDYYASGGTADVVVYHHFYGTFGAGEGLPGASLAATGVPVPPRKLEAVVEFTAPKCGCFVVPSRPGKVYHLMRSTAMDGGDIIDTVPGTSGTLRLEWDDSASTDGRAFFWVEEVNG